MAKLTTIETPPYEESYPYNVLYDILLLKENEDYTKEEVSAKEELRKYDIYMFEKYMICRLSDREIRSIECKYRFGMTLEDIGKMFGVTRERIRQILARAQRKLRYKIYTCARVSPSDYQRVKEQRDESREYYNKLLDFVMDTKNLTEDEITDILERRVVSEALSDDKDISELELSVRAYNCLKRAGIPTVSRIIEIDEASENSEWIFKVRNLGRKSVEEIRQRLLEHCGYTLKFYRQSDI